MCRSANVYIPTIDHVCRGSSMLSTGDKAQERLLKVDYVQREQVHMYVTITSYCLFSPVVGAVRDLCTAILYLSSSVSRMYT